MSASSAARSQAATRSDETVEVDLGQQRYGGPDGLLLEQLTDPVHLLEVRQRELGDEVAAVRDVGDGALALEDLQGLAQRHAGDAEALGQRVLAHLLPGMQTAGGDRTAQLGEHGLLRRRRPTERRGRVGAHRVRSRSARWASSQSRSAPSAGGARS